MGRAAWGFDGSGIIVGPVKRFRKLWIALGALGALVVIGLVALPFLIDVNRYRGLIENRAEQALGRDVELGEMKISLFPLGVRVDDVRIGSLPGEGPGDLLTVDHVKVGARLIPLLGKRLEVTGIPEETLRPGRRHGPGLLSEQGVAELQDLHRFSVHDSG